MAPLDRRMDATLQRRLDALLGLLTALTLAVVVHLGFRYGARGLAVFGLTLVLAGAVYFVAAPGLPGGADGSDGSSGSTD